MWPCPKRSPSAGKLILSEASYSLVGLCCSVSLTPAYSYLLRCLYIKVKPGLSKECIPLVEYWPWFSVMSSRAALGLHLVNFNPAVWNVGHLFTSIAKVFVNKNVDKRLCLPFSLCNFPVPGFLWMSAWVNERVSEQAWSTCYVPCAVQGAFKHSNILWFQWHFCVRVVHTILNVFQYESSYKILNFCISFKWKRKCLYFKHCVTT